MIDITHKVESLRTARATARVLCSAESLKRIKENTLPKGDLFNIAKAAGFLAAKQTHNLIPHCHPVSIENMEIKYEMDETGITILVYGKSLGRTGIEMEVLTAASLAALTIYDLLKPIDKNLEITSVKLTEKTGGKSQMARDMRRDITAAILVCSDSTAAGERKDESGILMKEYLEKTGVTSIEYAVVPDDEIKIKEQLAKWIGKEIQFIFTTGGTGLGPRDRTVEAVGSIIERKAEGITEAIRSHGISRNRRAMLSRAIAGQAKNSIIITLPGSRRGAIEGLDAIIPTVFHSTEMIHGGGHT